MIFCFRNRLDKIIDGFDRIGTRPVLPTSLTVYSLRAFFRKDLHSVVNVWKWSLSGVVGGISVGGTCGTMSWSLTILHD